MVFPTFFNVSLNLAIRIHGLGRSQLPVLVLLAVEEVRHQQQWERLCRETSNPGERKKGGRRSELPGSASHHEQGRGFQPSPDFPMKAGRSVVRI